MNRRFLKTAVRQYLFFQVHAAKSRCLSLFLRSLGAVFGACLAAVRNTGSIKSAADDVISGTRKVLDTAAADHHDAVLLKVVAFARDVGCHFNTVGETYSGDFTKS